VVETFLALRKFSGKNFIDKLARLEKLCLTLNQAMKPANQKKSHPAPVGRGRDYSVKSSFGPTNKQKSARLVSSEGGRFFYGERCFWLVRRRVVIFLGLIDPDSGYHRNARAKVFSVTTGNVFLVLARHLNLRGPAQTNFLDSF